MENRDKGRISDFWRVHRLNGKSVAAYEPGLGFYYQKQKSIPQKVLLLMLCDKGILKEKIKVRLASHQRVLRMIRKVHNFNKKEKIG